MNHAVPHIGLPLERDAEFLSRNAAIPQSSSRDVPPEEERCAPSLHSLDTIEVTGDMGKAVRNRQALAAYGGRTGSRGGRYDDRTGGEVFQDIHELMAHVHSETGMPPNVRQDANVPPAARTSKEMPGPVQEQNIPSGPANTDEPHPAPDAVKARGPEIPVRFRGDMALDPPAPVEFGAALCRWSRHAVSAYSSR